MSGQGADSALASFVAKWMQMRPELDLAQRFLAPVTRARRLAFLCLVQELEHTALGIAEAQPALLKLQWWAEELGQAGAGEASHPLTIVLAADLARVQVPAEAWHAAIAGALALREADPAPDLETLLTAHEGLHGPLAQIEASLFAPLDPVALARARALAAIVRDSANLAVALGAGRLPLPLDHLARHRLSRGDLGVRSAARDEALRAWWRELRGGGDALDARHVGPAAAATLSADHWRLGKAAQAADPAVALPALLARVPLRATLAAWRARRAGAAPMGS